MSILEELIPNPITRQIVEGVLIILFSYLVAKIVDYILTVFVKRLTAKTRTELDDKLLEKIHSPLTALVVLMGIRSAIHYLEMPDGIRNVFNHMIFVGTVGVGVHLLNSTLMTILSWYSEQIAIRTKSDVDHLFLPLINKIGRIFFVLIGVIVVLQHFQYNINALVMSLGVGTLAIGLAAQSTLANMIAGFLIMLDKPFRIGDRIELPSGKVGDVVDIGLRSTRIRDMSNNLIILPNADLISSQVLNFGYPNDITKVRLNVGVAYGSDIDRVKKALLEATEGVEGILSDPAPGVYFLNFGDSSLDFLLVASVDKYRSAFGAKDVITCNVDRIFREKGIDIPFPHRVIIQKS